MSHSPSRRERGAHRRRVSRRELLRGASAIGGLLLTGCTREAFVPPTVRGGLIGIADVLTMGTNRLLQAGQPLAREYQPSDIATDFPTWGQTNPPDETYQRLRRGGSSPRSRASGGARGGSAPTTGSTGSPACNL